MKTILKNATFYLDGSSKVDNGAMIIEDGLITAVIDIADLKNDEDAEIIDLDNANVLPGFIDSHIHGAVNHDAINGGAEVINAISTNVVKDGCTAFLASLTVVSHQDTLNILKSYKDLDIKQNGADFLGVHAEGPYLSQEYKALMDERYLRDPSINELNEMIQAAGDKLVSMTIAPELNGMETFIRALKQNNITTMIGHSAANAQQVLKALSYGADGFTHLYNANSQHLHREPGVVTGAFLDDNSFCELICDGFHIADDVIRMTYKYLTSKRIVIITDAMLGKGMPDGEFIFSNLLCQKEKTHVWVKETGRRAGSAFGMIDAVNYLIATVGCNLHDIVQMTAVNPAILIKATNKGRLYPNMDADLCVLDKDNQVKATFVRGRLVYQR